MKRDEVEDIKVIRMVKNHPRRRIEGLKQKMVRHGAGSKNRIAPDAHTFLHNKSPDL